MKKVIYSLLAISAFAFSAASCMQIDNFAAPAETFTGRIIDSNTGKNIIADQGEYRLKMWERSFKVNPGEQSIPVKADGTFNNTKLFIGTYDVHPQGAWWPSDTLKGLQIKDVTTRDFVVTPWLGITEFSAELQGDRIIVKGRLFASPTPEEAEEAGVVMPQLMDIRCFVSRTKFCGGANNLGAYYDLEEVRDGKKVKVCLLNLRKDWSQVTDGVVDDEGFTYSKDIYTFDIPAKAGYTFYIRLGVRVNDAYQMWNYSEIVRVDIPMN